MPPSDQGHAKDPCEAPTEKPDVQSGAVKQPSAETCDSSNIHEVKPGQNEDKQMEITTEGDMKDHSGMSAYFETTTIKTDASGSQGEGYYELSTNQKNRRTLLVTYHFLKSVTAPWPKHTLWKSNQIFRKVAQTHYTLLYLQTKEMTAGLSPGKTSN